MSEIKDIKSPLDAVNYNDDLTDEEKKRLEKFSEQIKNPEMFKKFKETLKAVFLTDKRFLEIIQKETYLLKADEIGLIQFYYAKVLGYGNKIDGKKETLNSIINSVNSMQHISSKTDFLNGYVKTNYQLTDDNNYPGIEKDIIIPYKNIESKKTREISVNKKDDIVRISNMSDLNNKISKDKIQINAKTNLGGYILDWRNSLNNIGSISNNENVKNYRTTDLKNLYEELSKDPQNNIKKDLSVSDAIKLSVKIVSDKLQYADNAKGIDQKSVQELFAGKIGVCRNFAEAVQAVFDSLKMHNSKLQNVYVKSVAVGNHAWNEFFVIGKDGKVYQLSVDPTNAKKDNILLSKDYISESDDNIINVIKQKPTEIQEKFKDISFENGEKFFESIKKTNRNIDFDDKGLLARFETKLHGLKVDDGKSFFEFIENIDLNKPYDKILFVSVMKYANFDWNKIFESYLNGNKSNIDNNLVKIFQNEQKKQLISMAQKTGINIKLEADKNLDIKNIFRSMSLFGKYERLFVQSLQERSKETKLLLEKLLKGNCDEKMIEKIGFFLGGVSANTENLLETYKKGLKTLSDNLDENIIKIIEGMSGGFVNYKEIDLNPGKNSIDQMLYKNIIEKIKINSENQNNFHAMAQYFGQNSKIFTETKQQLEKNNIKLFVGNDSKSQNVDHLTVQKEVRIKENIDIKKIDLGTFDKIAKEIKTGIERKDPKYLNKIFDLLKEDKDTVQGLKSSNIEGLALVFKIIGESKISFSQKKEYMSKLLNNIKGKDQFTIDNWEKVSKLINALKGFSNKENNLMQSKIDDGSDFEDYVENRLYEQEKINPFNFILDNFDIKNTTAKDTENIILSLNNCDINIQNMFLDHFVGKISDVFVFDKIFGQINNNQFGKKIANEYVDYNKIFENITSNNLQKIFTYSVSNDVLRKKIFENQILLSKIIVKDHNLLSIIIKAFAGDKNYAKNFYQHAQINVKFDGSKLAIANFKNCFDLLQDDKQICNQKLFPNIGIDLKKNPIFASNWKKYLEDLNGLNSKKEESIIDKVSSLLDDKDKNIKYDDSYFVCENEDQYIVSPDDLLNVLDKPDYYMPGIKDKNQKKEKIKGLIAQFIDHHKQYSKNIYHGVEDKFIKIFNKINNIDHELYKDFNVNIMSQFVKEIKTENIEGYNIPSILLKYINKDKLEKFIKTKIKGQNLPLPKIENEITKYFSSDGVNEKIIKVLSGALSE